ncbi:MAG: putative internalin [Frankiales bacterium]|nr:putative internalin [Frankiales bacterium]
MVLALGVGETARAAYDPLNADAFLTLVGGPFPTGASPSAVAYSPDGKLLATANRGDDTVTISEVLADGSLRPAAAPYPVGDAPSAVVFSPDGRLLAVANETDGTVSMFFVTSDLSGSGSLAAVGPPQTVGGGPVSLAFSPDGRYLAIASRVARSATLYSVSGGGALAAVSAPFPSGGGLAGHITTVRFSSRGVLAVGLDYPDAVYYFYRVGANGQMAQTGGVGFPDATLCDGQFSPDGTRFAWSNCYRQYDVVNIVAVAPDGVPSTTVAQIRFYPTRVSALAWSPDGSLLATANAAGATAANGPPPSNIPANSVSVFSVSQDVVTAVGDATPLGAEPTALAFSPDGLLSVAEGNAAGTSMFRVSRRGRLVPIGAPTTNPGVTSAQVAFSADGALLATATDVFTVSAAGVLRPVAGGAPAGDGWSGVAFSPSGSLVVRTNATTGYVTLAAVSAAGAATPIGMPQFVGTRPKRVAFSPDGALVAVIDATSVSTFRVNASSGLAFADRQVVSVDAPNDLAFQRTGARLTVVDGQDRLMTFSYESSGSLGEPTFTPVPADPSSRGLLRYIAYNADGTLLAASDWDGRLWLFAVASDGQLTVLDASPAASPVDMVFSPVSDTLFVGSGAGVSAWTTDGGRLGEISRPVGATAWTDALAVSPDAKLLAGSAYGVLPVLSLVAPWLEPRITSGPSKLSTSDQADIAFTANYPSRFECQLDGAAYRPCRSPWTATDLDDGPHVASVRGRDLSGTLQGEPVTWQWKSDVHGPTAPQPTAPMAGAVNLPPTGQEFSWSTTTDAVSTVDRYELWIDQAKEAEIAATACAAACHVAPSATLADGRHAWTVRAYDALGNMTETAQRPFAVDAVPPSAPGLAGPNDGAFLGDARPRLSWAASQDTGAGLAGYDVLLDGRPAAALPFTETGWTPPADLADGPHTWQVVAKDGVGNANASARRSFNVDQTSPVATLRVSPARFVPPFRVTLDASGSTDPGGSIARYEFDLDGDGSYEMSSANPRAETTLTTFGQHPLGVRVVDRVGRTATAASIVVGEAVTGQDSHEASVTIDDGAEYTRSGTVSLTIHPPPRSGAVTMIISNDGQPDQTLRRPVAQRVGRWLLAKGDGQRDRRIVYVVFYNSAGLQVTNGRVQDDILYDPYAPTVKDAVLRIAGHAASLSFRAHDRGSGLARWELRAGKRVLARRTRFKGAQKIILSKRVAKVRLVLRDKAGNTTRAAVRVRRG